MNTKKHLLRRLAILMLSAGMLLTCSGCGEAVEKQDTLSAMGTMITLTAYGKKADAGIAAAKSVIASTEAAVDPKLESSYTYQLNNAFGQAVVVSGQVADMVSLAQTINKQGSGALDLSIYPLVKLWGFENHKYYVPSDDEISRALKYLCMKDTIVTSFPSTNTYTVTIPWGCELTFASMARGCASDYAIEAMRQAGVESAIISMESNVQTLGVKPDGTNWNIAVKDPNFPANYLGVLNVGETAVSTTVNYTETFTDINGTTYHHLINPTSGYPTTNALRSVTVICQDGTKADALSTAMFVLGQSRALSYWRNYGKDFDLVLVNNQGDVICTAGLIEHFTLTNTEDYTLTYTE